MQSVAKNFPGNQYPGYLVKGIQKFQVVMPYQKKKQFLLADSPCRVMEQKSCYFVP